MSARNIQLIAIQVLLAVVMILYLFGREKGLPVLLFWPVVWSLILVSFLIAYSLSSRYKLASIVILSVSISSIILAVSPDYYQIGRDSIFDAQYASTISKEGLWNPTLGAGFAENYYGHNPVLHFLTAFTSLTTGLSTYTTIKYFFLITHRLLIVLLVFLVVSTILGSNIKMHYLSILIFISSAGMAFISVSRRSTASIFLLLSIYCLLKSDEKENRELWTILFMIFSLMIVLANHSISYYFLSFLAGAWVYGMAIKYIPSLKGGNFPRVFYKLIYFSTVFFVWELLLAKVLVKGDVSYILDIKNTLLSSYGLGSFLDVDGVSPLINIYHGYETLIIYLAQLAFMLLGALGLMFFVRRLFSKPSYFPHENFLLYFAMYGFTMYFFSALLLRTDQGVAVSIFLWFFGVPISLLAAYFLHNVARKRLKSMYAPAVAFFILFLFTGSLLMGIYTPRITNRGPGQDIVIGQDLRSKTEEAFYSAKWLNETYTNQVKFIADIDLYETYTGFFEFDVNSYWGWVNRTYLGSQAEILDLISRPNMDFGFYEHTKRYDNIDFFVINLMYLKHRSSIFGNPVPSSNLKKFDEISSLDKVYNNDEIIIYKIMEDG